MIPQRFNRPIQIAVKLAKSAYAVHKMGCVVLKNGRILGKGCNNYHTGSHCERTALGKNWRSEFEGCTVVIIRIRKAQPYGMARPCKDCMELIRACGAKQIIYSTNDVDNPIILEKWP